MKGLEDAWQYEIASGRESSTHLDQRAAGPKNCLSKLPPRGDDRKSSQDQKTDKKYQNVNLVFLKEEAIMKSARKMSKTGTSGGSGKGTHYSTNNQNTRANIGERGRKSR